ncbi:30S ribosome-binding factor RbfA [Geopsychrobacter electrodiphilus]|uniref:30S ribosome-binding factor RbfA n=1 Tax=Geopsychrobacter electrodiphilus TaxID=225196 RepID=UPI00035D067D|nr:30S ribosome-binding factor RbfA [Geopsychrobacter electrodiphilus]
MSSYRPERVAGQMHKIVSEMLLSGEIKDPRVALITLTEVNVTRDLSLARIYYTCLGDEAQKQEAAEGLNKVAPFVRRLLGQQMKLRHIPEIRFEYDKSSDTGRRIEELLREADSENKHDH